MHPHNNACKPNREFQSSCLLPCNRRAQPTFTAFFFFFLLPLTCNHRQHKLLLLNPPAALWALQQTQCAVRLTTAPAFRIAIFLGFYSLLSINPWPMAGLILPPVAPSCSFIRTALTAWKLWKACLKRMSKRVSELARFWDFLKNWQPNSHHSKKQSARCSQL